MAVIRGNPKNNTLATTKGSDTVYGLAGDDWVLIYGGADTIFGGAGSDTVSFAGANKAIQVELASTKLQATGVNKVKLSSVENAVGSSFADKLLGNKVANTLNGEGGNDRIYGGAGNDLLIGGAGSDLYSGGTGRDTASFQFAKSGVKVDLTLTGAQDTGQGVDKFSSIETVLGSDFNDRLIGNGKTNTIIGGKGDDFLAGFSLGGGRKGDVDTLIGGSGSDTFAVIDFPVSRGTFVVDFQQGKDQIYLEGFKIDDFSEITQIKRSGITFIGITGLDLTTAEDALISLRGNFTLTADDFIL